MSGVRRAKRPCVHAATAAAAVCSIRRSGNAFCWLDVNSDVRVLQTRANRFRPCVYISVRELPWLDGWREAAGLHVTRAGDVGSLDSIDPDIAYGESELACGSNQHTCLVTCEPRLCLPSTLTNNVASSHHHKWQQRRAKGAQRCSAHRCA